MLEQNARLYVVGDRETGILIVATNPLQTVPIERAQIEAVAKDRNMTFDQAFGAFAGAAAKLILENDDSEVPASVPEVPAAIEHQIAKGATISDADFCFIADIDLGDVIRKRDFYPPIQAFLEQIGRQMDLRKVVEGDSEADLEAPGSARDTASEDRRDG